MERFHLESFALLQASATVHELRIQSSMLALYPPKEAARQHWMHEFHKALAIICSIPKLEPARYDSFQASAAGGKGGDVSAELLTKKKATYSHLLARIPEKTYLGAYDVIELTLSQMEEYVRSWLSYQVGRWWGGGPLVWGGGTVVLDVCYGVGLRTMDVCYQHYETEKKVLNQPKIVRFTVRPMETDLGVV